MQTSRTWIFNECLWNIERSLSPWGCGFDPQQQQSKMINHIKMQQLTYKALGTIKNNFSHYLKYRNKIKIQNGTLIAIFASQKSFHSFWKPR